MRYLLTAETVIEAIKSDKLKSLGFGSTQLSEHFELVDENEFMKYPSPMGILFRSNIMNEDRAITIERLINGVHLLRQSRIGNTLLELFIKNVALRRSLININPHAEFEPFTQFLLGYRLPAQEMQFLTRLYSALSN